MLPINTKVTVWTSSTDVVLIEAREFPKTVFLSNTSDNIITVAIWNNAGNDAVSLEGVVLQAKQGMALDVSPYENEKRLYINAIATWAGSVLGVTIL